MAVFLPGGGATFGVTHHSTSASGASMVFRWWESGSCQSRPVDAANRRKQAVLFCKKRTKKLLFIKR
jgi:hypothetical protein